MTTEEIVHRAVLAVCSKARNVADAQTLLEALGLMEEGKFLDPSFMNITHIAYNNGSSPKGM